MNRNVDITELSDRVRVAVIIQAGKIIPRWFDILDMPASQRVQVKEVCYTWNYYEGAAKILNFAVTDNVNTYRLSLNTKEFTWRLGIAVCDT